jgi:hypothetical protein
MDSGGTSVCLIWLRVLIFQFAAGPTSPPNLSAKRRFPMRKYVRVTYLLFSACAIASALWVMPPLAAGQTVTAGTVLVDSASHSCSAQGTTTFTCTYESGGGIDLVQWSGSNGNQMACTVSPVTPNLSGLPAPGSGCAFSVGNSYCTGSKKPFQCTVVAQCYGYTADLSTGAVSPQLADTHWSFVCVQR